MRYIYVTPNPRRGEVERAERRLAELDIASAAAVVAAEEASAAVDRAVQATHVRLQACARRPLFGT